MPRALKSGKPRHDPLHVQLDDDELLAKYGRVSQPGKRKKSRTQGKNDGEEDANGEVVLDPKTSQRIFELAKDQQDELEMPEDDEEETTEVSSFSRPRMPVLQGDDDDDDELYGDDIQDAEEIFNIDEEDMQTLDALLPPSSTERRTLADIIFSKLEQGESGNSAVIQKVQQGCYKPRVADTLSLTRRVDPDKPDPALGLDPKVVESYTKVALILSTYKSGPLPKLFKIIPTLPSWARILALTRPEEWSPHACRAATKIFISSMKPPQAQLFLSVVLLDAIREDIQQNKKLNVQYYEALKKALYKPSAFFKGIIFPMLDSGCSLKEAAIVASVVAKNKVPVLHASAALMRIAEMDYTGPNSLFIRVLVDKKFQLPFKVVDALVFHFIRLSNTYKAKTRGDAEKLPVLWHQSLLAFVQRYASDLTPEQKDALLDVVRATPHAQIGPEVRRELVNSVPRGAPRTDGEGDIVML
ncbi:snoRNA-binding rRNA-processing protein, variant 2 [Pleurotus ostreatus]|nr:snoRNA-binding rRNA-processing protein, variant 2 [Pleurotus ostreatus]